MYAIHVPGSSLFCGRAAGGAAVRSGPEVVAARMCQPCVVSVQSVLPKGDGQWLSWHRAGEVSLPGSGQFFDGGLPGLAYPHPHPCLWRAGMIGVPRRHLPGVQVWRSLCRHSPRLCSLSSILASRAVHGQDRTAGRRLPSLRVALRISPSGAKGQHARLLVCRNGRPA